MSLATETGIIPPPRGWEEKAYYVVEVALYPSNIVHRSIFYTGFLNGPDRSPGGYAQIMNISYDRPYDDWRGVHYMKALRRLDRPGDFDEARNT